jgi:hypothetical protein
MVMLLDGDNQIVKLLASKVDDDNWGNIICRPQPQILMLIFIDPFVVCGVTEFDHAAGSSSSSAHQFEPVHPQLEPIAEWGHILLQQVFYRQLFLSVSSWGNLTTLTPSQ